jgi:phage tail-like protein
MTASAVPSGRLADIQPSHRFVVLVDDAPYGIFTECDLPVIEWKTDPISEGGLNSYVHQLLGPRKESSITFKNGVGAGELVAWYLDVMNGKFPAASGKKLRRSVTVILLDSLKKPVMTWQIEKALPVEWRGPQLKTSENSIAVQSMKLVCGEITIIPGEG